MPVSVRANDGVVVTMSWDAAHLSKFIKDILPDNEIELNEAIDAPGVDGQALQLVAEFLEYRKDHTYPKVSRPLKKDAGNDLKKAGVPEWYADFVEKNKRWEVIFKLIKAAEFMNVDDLVQLCAARIGSFVVAMEPQQKAQVFALPTGPLTPEQEAKLREEHKWAEEEPDLAATIGAGVQAAAAGAAAPSST